MSKALTLSSIRETMERLGITPQRMALLRARVAYARPEDAITAKLLGFAVVTSDLMPVGTVALSDGQTITHVFRLDQEPTP